MSQQFGKPISLKEANGLLENFNDIKQKSKLHFTQMIQQLGANNAKGAETYFKKEVNTYVFDKSLVAPYFQADYQNAEFLLVVQGASAQDDPANKIVKDEPTVMLAAADGIRTNGVVTGFKVYAPTSDTDPIREHPPKYTVVKLVSKNDEFKALFPGAESSIDVEDAAEPTMIFSIQDTVLEQNKHEDGFTDSEPHPVAVPLSTLSGIEFGKPINLGEAKTILNDGLRIKERRGLVNAGLSAILNNKERKEAKEYFTGDHAGYIFTRKQLNHLLNQIPERESDENDCVVFFSGAREDVNSAEKHHGKPSLVAFVYKPEKDGRDIIALNRVAKDTSTSDDGEEHPPTIISKNLNLHDGIPARIKAGDVAKMRSEDETTSENLI